MISSAHFTRERNQVSSSVRSVYSGNSVPTSYSPPMWPSQHHNIQEVSESEAASSQCKFRLKYTSSCFYRYFSLNAEIHWDRKCTEGWSVMLTSVTVNRAGGGININNISGVGTNSKISDYRKKQKFQQRHTSCKNITTSWHMARGHCCSLLLGLKVNECVYVSVYVCVRQTLLPEDLSPLAHPSLLARPVEEHCTV